MAQHVLWFPHEEGHAALLYKFNSNSHVVVRALLEESGHGFYVQFDLDVDGDYGGKIAFLASDDEPRNRRAEEALTFLTDGTHMRVTGNACLVDIDPSLVDYVAKSEFRA